jgi:hypothetical protein
MVKKTKEVSKDSSSKVETIPGYKKAKEGLNKLKKLRF